MNHMANQPSIPNTNNAQAAKAAPLRQRRLQEPFVMAPAVAHDASEPVVVPTSLTGHQTPRIVLKKVNPDGSDGPELGYFILSGNLHTVRLHMPPGAQVAAEVARGYGVNMAMAGLFMSDVFHDGTVIQRSEPRSSGKRRWDDFAVVRLQPTASGQDSIIVEFMPDADAGACEPMQNGRGTTTVYCNKSRRDADMTGVPARHTAPHLTDPNWKPGQAQPNLQLSAPVTVATAPTPAEAPAEAASEATAVVTAAPRVSRSRVAAPATTPEAPVTVDEAEALSGLSESAILEAISGAPKGALHQMIALGAQNEVALSEVGEVSLVSAPRSRRKAAAAS